MFNSIRWRLVRWNIAIIALIILLAGGVAYGTALRRLPRELDRDLSDRAMVVGVREVEQGTFTLGRQGYRGGVFYLAVDAEETPLVNPQQVPVPPLPALTPGDYTPRYATVQMDGEPVRLFIRPLPPPPQQFADRRPRAAAIIVGASLVPMYAALQRLAVALIGGGVAGLLLLVGGSWFLAGRALVPIETAFRKQQEFIADASHELRTPLTVLRSSADLLDRHRDEPLADNGDLFDDLRGELGRLERLAGDLLTLARSDLNEASLAVAPLDLRVEAADVVRQTTPLAREHGLTLVCEAGDDEVATEADPDRLRQILLILLDNAIAHTPPGGTITVGAARQGGEAVLTVRDTGGGIAAEHLERIFDRFYRAERSRSRAHGGTGLGLAIARSLVEAHHGQIALTSAVGRGTTVTIRLRLLDQSPSLVNRLGQLAARVTQRSLRQ